MLNCLILYKGVISVSLATVDFLVMQLGMSMHGAIVLYTLVGTQSFIVTRLAGVVEECMYYY